MRHPAAKLRTIARWMNMMAIAGDTVGPEQLADWAKGMMAMADDVDRATPDPLIAAPTDRLNAVEADLLIDRLHGAVKRLAYLAEQAATHAELIEIDAGSSAILDSIILLGRGIARPVHSQPQTGA